jgi:hypothetical protein
MVMVRHTDMTFYQQPDSADFQNYPEYDPIHRRKERRENASI